MSVIQAQAQRPGVNPQVEAHLHELLKTWKVKFLNRQFYLVS